jgi:hypothetical protein
MATAPSWRLAGVAAAATLCWLAVICLSVVAVRHHWDGVADIWLDLFVLGLFAVSVWITTRLVKATVITAGIGPTRVEVSTHPLRPGETCEMFVAQAGPLTLQDFDVRVVCHERASYTQGTDVRTETCCVYEESLLHWNDVAVAPQRPFEEHVALQIPSGAMHSFHSPHNEVQWHVVVRGSAAGRPTYERWFPIVVHPPRPASKLQGSAA